MSNLYTYSDKSITYPKGPYLRPLKAIYHETRLDKGNPFIEALPTFLSESDEEILKRFTEELRITPTRTGVTVQEQLEEIELLDEVRLPLPFSLPTFHGWCTALKKSCRARWKFFQEASYVVKVNNTDFVQNGFFKQIEKGDSGNGFVLVGPSGSGKTTAIESITNNIPQVLIHDFPNGEFIQIVWLHVDAPTGGSLQDLFRSIAEKIDEILGNISLDGETFYVSQVLKRKSIDQKAEYITKLIKSFGIGAIILDEVQSMDFTRNLSNSFNSFLKLTNPTKVAIISVGLQSSIEKLYARSYTSRRAGDLTDSSLVDTRIDAVWLRSTARSLMKNQWTKEPVKITEDLVDALLDASGRIISDMKKIWMTVQENYVRAVVKPEITPEYIAETASKIERLQKLRKAEADELKFKETNTDDYKKIGNTENPLPPANIDSIMKRVKQSLTDNGLVYNDSKIRTSIENVRKRNRNNELTDDELVQKSINAVKRKPSDKRKSVDSSLSPNVDLESGLKNFASSDKPLI